MGGGGDVALAVGEAGVGDDPGGEGDLEFAAVALDLDGPWGVAAAVEEGGGEVVDALGELADGGALVAFVDEVEAVADGAVGEGLEDR